MNDTAHRGGHTVGYIGIMENQMEKNMENKMETATYRVISGL